MDISTVFLYVFTGAFFILALNLMLGDVIDGVLSIESDVFNTTTLLCFVGVTSAFAYILERNTLFSVWGILIVAFVVGLIITLLMNLLVFIPLSKMGTTTAFTMKDLEGLTGEITDAISVGGIGEVLITTPMSKVSKYAKSMNDEAISQGEKVLVIYSEGNTLIVRRYNNNIVDGELEETQ